jgi:hypothetical protein
VVVSLQGVGWPGDGLADDGSAVYSDVVFSQRAAPRVLAAQPRRGLAGGGTVVAVLGADFAGAGEACVFGSGSAAGGVAASTALLRCEAPGASGGEASVELSLAAGGDGAEAGVSFWYDAEAVVRALSPAEGLAEGGAVVRLSGAGFVNAEELGVVMGTLGPLAARWLDAGSVVATSPAGAPGRLLTVAVAASSAAADFPPRSGVAFAVAGESAGLGLALVPAASLDGGAGVALVAGWSGSAASLACVFGSGGVRVSASASAGGAVSCLAPSGGVGFTTVTLVEGEREGECEALLHRLGDGVSEGE